jgi:hypothetical protein
MYKNKFIGGNKMPKNSSGKELYQIPKGHWARYKNENYFYQSDDGKQYWDLGWFKDEKVVENPVDLLIKGDLVEILYTGNGEYYLLKVEKVTEDAIETSHITISRSSMTHYDNDLKEIPMIRAIFTHMVSSFHNEYSEQWRYKEKKISTTQKGVE